MLIVFITNPMKRFLFGLFLLVNAAPLFAKDEGGDGAYIPGYQELVREGYGPRHEEHSDDYRRPPVMVMAPKPTQAFYGKGYTVYYGYMPLPERAGATSAHYAFGYPLDFFRQKMPSSITDIHLNRYAEVVADNQHRYYVSGDGPAQGQKDAITTVQSTVPAAVSTPAPVLKKAKPTPAAGQSPAPAPQQASAQAPAH